MWQKEHIDEEVSDDLMAARTALSAACLGVELLWNSNPSLWSLDDVIEMVMAAPEFTVDVPAPTARGYEVEDQACRLHHLRIELRICFALAVKSKFGEGVVCERILSFLWS